jgi:putative oxidoreductase
MNGIARFAPLLGRILVGQLFLLSGLSKIFAFGPTAAYMASKGLPMIQLLLVLTIVIEVGGGLMIIFGWRAKIAAAIMFLWLIPTTFIFHNFWGVPDAEKMAQQIQFQKNLAVMGAMLFIYAFGPGPYSLRKD